MPAFVCVPGTETTLGQFRIFWVPGTGLASFWESVIIGMSLIVYGMWGDRCGRLRLRPLDADP